MGHREDLLDGAVRCLREKGYARTTARDIVAASGTNLGSIGYHYGSTEALLNAAVVRAIDDFGQELGRVVVAGLTDGTGATPLERFERYWTHVLASFEATREIWQATFDVFGMRARVPEVQTAIADGLQDGRLAWAQMLHGMVPPQRDPDQTQAVGSIHQALLSGVLVQWLVDPERAPSAAGAGRSHAGDGGPGHREVSRRSSAGRRRPRRRRPRGSSARCRRAAPWAGRPGMNEARVQNQRVPETSRPSPDCST